MPTVASATVVRTDVTKWDSVQAMIRAVEEAAGHQDAKSHFAELGNAPSERGWRAWR